MHETISLQAQVDPEWAGMRVDQIAAVAFPDYSRSRLKKWIEEGDILVNGEQLRPREKLYGGEKITLECKIEIQQRWQPEPIEIDIVYEDDHILILNKAAGLVVHPAAGHHGGTLLNALLHHCPQLNSVPRAGIVHRLDKDTTGLMVVAKTIPAQTSLVSQLQDRSMGREYEAVVQGVLTGGGTVDKPMGRHSRNRLKMAISAAGKEAITHFRVLRRFRAHTHIRLKLESGRTHQIRVHMTHINYPIQGDPLYGGRQRLPKGCEEEFLDSLRGFKRQALHAKRLELMHPITHEDMEWEVDLPMDMVNLLKHLALDTKLNPHSQL